MKSTSFASVLSTIAAAIVSFAAFGAEAAPLVESSILIDNVALRPGVEADVRLSVYTNGKTPCKSNTIFAIHGVTHTAATWKPLAQAMFDENPPGRPVCRVVAIDLPGHGQSPPPRGALYGELNGDDYVQAILASLDRLQSVHKIRARTVMGHSMGGVLIQMTQQALLDQGSSLRDALKIDHAILLAPSLPAAVPWGVSDGGVADAFAAIFGVTTTDLGPIMSVPPAFWATVYFQNLAGAVVPGTPTGPEAEALGYVAPESLDAFAQVTGCMGQTRPEVSAAIFAPELGTDLDIVTNENDPFVRPEENTALYDYLTADASRVGLTVITGAETAHDAHVADPAGWLDKVAGSVAIP